MPKTVICPCDKQAKYSDNASTVGDIRKETGFCPVFCYGGDLIYLCPICTEKAKRLAKELFGIVKNNHIYFPNLLEKK